MGSKGEKHLSRLAMPKTWKIKRKGIKFVARPLPGAHPIKSGIPLVVALRDLLKYAKTSKEVKNMLYNQEILVDGKRRKELKFIVGLMDVISIPKINKQFRVLLSKKGKITLLEIKKEEAKIKLAKIKKKTYLKNKKLQLNLSDGKNILVDKDEHRVGDTLVIEIPSQKIKDSIKLEKGNLIYLVGGKHVGEVGTLEEIKEDRIKYKKDKTQFETLKRYAFVVGKDKPVILISEK